VQRCSAEPGPINPAQTSAPALQRITIASQNARKRPEVLRRTLGEHIECEFLLDRELWPASVDPGQLASALLNLVLNARDAMPEGGRLTVEVRNVSLDEADIDVNGEARPGDYVMVAVTDTGSGMNAEVAGRAFEPFFTTKEVGKGTGLGASAWSTDLPSNPADRCKSVPHRETAPR
jgi:signal transduction histidine kinase